MRIAWLADGTLETWDGTTVRGVVSPFARRVEERDASIRRRNAWKTQGRGARFGTWAAPVDELQGVRDVARFVALSRGRADGELLTVLQSHGTSALLARPEPDGDDELRLYHAAEHHLRGVAAGPTVDRIAVSLAEPAGGAYLGLLTRDGSHLVPVTEGDVIDGSPRWDPSGRLLYQSAGIGRDAQGLFAGRSPFAICRLDPAQGAVEEVAVDPARDLLSPVAGPDGTLHYVRRPFERKAGASLAELVKDFLLFPLRLGRAVLGWLDFFTVRYSGRPLITSGGPRREGPDPRKMLLLGNVVDVENARRESLQAGDAVPALVPQSWELVRDRGGRIEVVARGVLAFDVAPDGTVVLSNGRGVFVVDPAGERTLVAERERVETVVAW